MNSKEKYIKIATLISACLWLITMFPQVFTAILFKKEKAAAIGIIGGADGPTAIFLTSKVHIAILPILFFILTVIGCLRLVVIKKKNN